MICHNIPLTTTGVTSAHLKASRTHLAMTLPSVYQCMKPQQQPTPEQTNEKVRKYQPGDKVLVQDFCPESTTNGKLQQLQQYVVYSHIKWIVRVIINKSTSIICCQQ